MYKQYHSQSIGGPVNLGDGKILELDGEIALMVSLCQIVTPVETFTKSLGILRLQILMEIHGYVNV